MICNKKTFHISKYNEIQAEGKIELKWRHKFPTWRSVSKEIRFPFHSVGDFCYVAGLKQAYKYTYIKPYSALLGSVE